MKTKDKKSSKAQITQIKKNQKEIANLIDSLAKEENDKKAGSGKSGRLGKRKMSSSKVNSSNVNNLKEEVNLIEKNIDIKNQITIANLKCLCEQDEYSEDDSTKAKVIRMNS